MQALQEHPAYIYNQIALRLGSFATAVAAVAVCLLYPAPNNLLVTLAVVAILFMFMTVRNYILPRARTFAQLDVMVTLYLFPVFFLQWYCIALYPKQETSAGAACLIVLSSLLFTSTVAFCSVSIVSAAMWLSFKWVMSDGPTPNEIVQLLIMAPAIALVTRFSVTRTLDQLRDSRNREQQRVSELRETLQKLQEETRLRKESEVQLLQARKRESLGLMAAGVAHDFNNTLRAIGAVSELISLRSQEPESRDYAEEIGKAVQQAAGICRQMLIYTGRSTADKSAIDLHEIISDLLPLLRASLSRHVTVEFTADVEQAIVVGNLTQFQQVLMNLVKNGAEAIDGVGKVTIQLSRRKVSSERMDDEQKWLGQVEPGDYFELTVADTGSGMSEDVLSQIFDPYFTTKRTGHGLGLSSVQGITRSHSAILGVISQPGQGTTISLLIPDQPIVVPQAPSPESRLESQTDAATKNILVVDDDDLVRTPLVTMLEHLGWNVAEASSGEDAIATVQHQTDFAAVLIDYSMSGMNGRETLHALRAAGCQCPAILCSGYISNPDDSSNHQGFGGFLQKPFRHQELATILDRIVRQ